MTAMAKLVIFGAGAMARLAYRYFAHDSDHQVVAFTVDAAYRDQDEFCGLPLVDFEDLRRLYPPGETALFVAVGYRNMNRVRAERFAAVKALGYTLPSYVSSRCTYLSEYLPGSNCFILEDNTIQPGVRIGDDVVLWSGNHVGHDAEIGDHCFVTSHVVISGFVKIGSHSFLGVNATLRDSITIAPRTLVGAGAVITGDTVEGGVYVPERSKLLGKSSDQVDL
jgi:sugar O-acyltransferase (sialic acid O-acetyltransferase NeuD family)